MPNGFHFGVAWSLLKLNTFYICTIYTLYLDTIDIVGIYNCNLNRRSISFLSFLRKHKSQKNKRKKSEINSSCSCSYHGRTKCRGDNIIHLRVDYT